MSLVAGLSLGSAWAATDAIRLRSVSPRDGSPIEVGVESLEGRPLPGARLGWIEMLTAADLRTPKGSWRPLPRAGAPGEGGWVAEPPEPGVPMFLLARENLPSRIVEVRDVAALRAAVVAALPGTRIRIAAGLYAGGLTFANVQGRPGQPVVLCAADSSQPPVFQGGTSGMQFSDPAYLELEDLVFSGATGNGLNIDDGGTFDTPARGVVLRRLRVTDVGPTGNRDGIKLSGVREFRVEGCTVERWGTGGSAVDMVGCHDGVIEGNLFRHLASTAAEVANGVQTKGGTARIVIRRNRFEHAGSRAVNIGGSTGLTLFRPPLVEGGEQAEARDIRVEGNTFLGSGAPFAFVGVDGADVRFNTVYRPGRWALRILQETTATGFVPCRNGRFTDNLIVFHSSEWSSGGINVGSGTAPATFVFARNWWFCMDAPTRSRPSLPTPETGGIYGQPVEFRDAAAGDLSVVAGSPAAGVGAGALPGGG